MAKRYVVAQAAEIPPGGRKLVTAGGREVVIFNLDQQFYALINRCPHEGASLFHGDCIGVVSSSRPGEYEYARRGEMLRCPWHGWEFDIRTGQSWCDRARLRVVSYETTVEAGGELVKGPYVAESVPVEEDGLYLVVTV